MSDTSGFVTADYAVFISCLVISTLIGIFYAIKDRKIKDDDNYQFGDRKTSPITVGLSIIMSYISATTLLGFPADTYIYGTVIIWYTISSIIPCITAYLYFIPFVRILNLKTMYQLLEYRFNSQARKLLSTLDIFGAILLAGARLYLPPLALEALTPLSFEAAVLITSAIVIFYTVLGGYKAVLWTDTLQGLIMIAGTLATFIRTVIVVGGFGEIWETVDRGGRFTHLDFNLDPTLQRTFWTIFLGNTFSRVRFLGLSPSSVQRFVSCKSVRDARIAAIIACAGFIFFAAICTLLGCAAYTYFTNCDPVMNGEIRKYDQIIPLLVSKIFNDAPGMTGLFVAAVYSGALSSVSTTINYCSLLVVQDFVLSFYPDLNQRIRTSLSKIIALCIGLVITAVAFGFQFLGGTVFTLSVTITGCINGPWLGIFFLAIFFPWTNKKGAICGTLIALAINLWVSIGAFVYGKPPGKVRALGGSVENCSASTSLTSSPWLQSSTGLTTFSMTSSNDFTSYQEEKPYLYYTLYALSFQYYIILGFIVCVVSGLLISFITKPDKPSEMDPKLFIPFIDNKHLPLKFRKFFRFGVPEDLGSEKEAEDDGIRIPRKIKKTSFSVNCYKDTNAQEGDCISTKL